MGKTSTVPASSRSVASVLRLAFRPLLVWERFLIASMNSPKTYAGSVYDRWKTRCPQAECNAPYYFRSLAFAVDKSPTMLVNFR